MILKNFEEFEEFQQQGIRNQESYPPKLIQFVSENSRKGCDGQKQSSNLWAWELFAIDSRIYRLCHYCHLPGLAFFSLNFCS